MYIEFMGYGNSHSKDLGESSALVYDKNQAPLLLVDIGSDTYHILKEKKIDVSVNTS